MASLLWGGPWEKKTPWQLDTSEETDNAIIVATGGEGKLYFVNEGDAGDKFMVPYSFISVGVAKGAALNYAKSYQSDPSGGITNVRCKESRTFGPHSFPCMGLMLNLGGTAGTFMPSFVSHSGLAVAVFFFEMIPFAGIVTWGRFNSILPGAGPSLGLVSYEKAKPTVSVPSFSRPD